MSAEPLAAGLLIPEERVTDARAAGFGVVPHYGSAAEEASAHTTTYMVRERWDGAGAVLGDITFGDTDFTFAPMEPPTVRFLSEGGDTFAEIPHDRPLVFLGGREGDAPIVVDLGTGGVTIRDEAGLSEAARAFWNMVRAMADMGPR